MLRQERSAAGQAQERLLAAEKELQRLQGTEAQLDKAEKVLSSLLDKSLQSACQKGLHRLQTLALP